MGGALGRVPRTPRPSPIARPDTGSTSMDSGRTQPTTARARHSSAGPAADVAPLATGGHYADFMAAEELWPGSGRGVRSRHAGRPAACRAQVALRTGQHLPRRDETQQRLVPASADPLSTFGGGSCGTGRARGRVCPRARARCAYRAAEGFRGAHILLLEVAENADRPAQGRQRPSRTCTDWPPFRCHRDHLIVVSSLTIRSCLLDRPPMRSGDVRAMEDGWISRAHPRLIPVTSGSTAGRAGMAHPAAAHAQPGVLITGGRGGAGEKHRGG